MSKGGQEPDSSADLFLLAGLDELYISGPGSVTDLLSSHLHYDDHYR